MTREAVIESVRQKWVTDVQTPQSLDVLHDNAPTNGEAKVDRHEFSVQTDSPEAQRHSGSPGNRRYRIVGRGVATLRVKGQNGDKTLIEIGEAITTAFCGVTIADPIIEYGRPSFVGKPARIDGGFVRIMHIPFEADVFG